MEEFTRCFAESLGFRLRESGMFTPQSKFAESGEIKVVGHFIVQGDHHNKSDLVTRF